MVRGWVLLLGLACCVRVLHGQVVAEGDLGKVQTAWGKTIASETLKMSRQSESEVDTGVVDKEPLTSTDSVMVQIRSVWEEVDCEGNGGEEGLLLGMQWAVA